MGFFFAFKRHLVHLGILSQESTTFSKKSEEMDVENDSWILGNDIFLIIFFENFVCILKAFQMYFTNHKFYGNFFIRIEKKNILNWDYDVTTWYYFIASINKLLIYLRANIFFKTAKS